MEERTDIIEAAHGDMEDSVEDGIYIVRLNPPIIYEKKTYDRIDLTGLDNIRAADMIAVSRKLNRSGNVDFMQETSLEYAINIAHRATGLPLEFFDQLRPAAALRVKNAVTAFLYGQG